MPPADEAADLSALEARIAADAEARSRRPTPDYEPAEPAAPEAEPVDVVAQIQAAQKAIEEAAVRAPKRPCADCGKPVPALTSAAVPATFSAARDEVPRPDPGHVCADCYVGREHRAQFSAALASIPERYRWAQFGHADMAKRVKPCRGIQDGKVDRPLQLDARGRGLVKAERLLLMGPAGAGKTVLAAALLRELVDLAAHPDVPQRVAERARLARFLHAYDLTSDDREALGQARAASVLVVDDLGRDADTFKSAVAEVIHRRHAQGRPTWITTGLQPAELLARYPSLERRLFEGAAVYSFF